jgi:beta-glucosidase
MRVHMRRIASSLYFWPLLLCAACGSTQSEPPCIVIAAPPATESAEARTEAVLSRMSRADKLHMVAGGAPADWYRQPLPRGAQGRISALDCLSVPALYFADGSVGLRDTVGQATALPSSLASAATWDLSAAARYGRVIGAESRAYGMNVNLGGNVNLSGREPRGGRIFETKGEDPLLAGRITAAHVKAIQEQHVIGGLKHFAFNDQETGRNIANVAIDERSARETDLLAFEIALAESGARSVMCSYNLVNADYACENSWLLNDVLKTDWGFDGFVLSDWDATHSTVASALGGLDQEQPDSNYFGAQLSGALDRDEIAESRLDDMVRRILRAMFEVGLFDLADTREPIDAEADADVAQETEQQGAVLLKNDGALPLDRDAIGSIAVIGSHADVGVLSGGGSAQVSPVGGAALTEIPAFPGAWSRVVWDPSSPLKAIRTEAPAAHVTFDDGTDTTSAATLAAGSDVAIVFVSQWTSEGLDLPNLNFTDFVTDAPSNQDELVRAVAAANPKTIVVLETGGAQLMPWLASVPAVLEAWYPGQRGGEAIANILFGDVNPSGKLPLTFPAKLGDLPRPSIDGFNGGGSRFDVDYSIEGVNTGYKWYEAKGLMPLFPFGFGLSYTRFEITAPRLEVSGVGDGIAFDVSCNVRNLGERAGAEVVQVYLQLPAETGEAKRLVGWDKVALGTAEDEAIAIHVAGRDSAHPLSFWDVEAHAWRNAPGRYAVFVGTSARDLTELGSFELP